MKTYFQDRLAKFHDKMRKKVIDDLTLQAGSFVDMIRLKKKVSHNYDILSTTIEEADTINVLLPALKDIPLRKVDVSSLQEPVLVRLPDPPAEGEEPDPIPEITPTPQVDIKISPYLVPSFPIEVYIPLEHNVMIGDILIKIFFNNDGNEHYVICLEVTDILATFGQSRIIYEKYKTHFYDDKLDDRIIDVIKSQTLRRIETLW